jgi:hypothetical protein
MKKVINLLMMLLLVTTFVGCDSGNTSWGLKQYGLKGKVKEMSETYYGNKYSHKFDEKGNEFSKTKYDESYQALYNTQYYYDEEGMRTKYQRYDYNDNYTYWGTYIYQDNVITESESKHPDRDNGFMQCIWVRIYSEEGSIMDDHENGLELTYDKKGHVIEEEKYDEHFVLISKSWHENDKRGNKIKTKTHYYKDFGEYDEHDYSYIYTNDDKGNWIIRTKYDCKTNKKVEVVSRTIIYYEKKIKIKSWIKW